MLGEIGWTRANARGLPLKSFHAEFQFATEEESGLGRNQDFVNTTGVPRPSPRVRAALPLLTPISTKPLEPM